MTYHVDIDLAVTEEVTVDTYLEIQHELEKYDAGVGASPFAKHYGVSVSAAINDGDWRDALTEIYHASIDACQRHSLNIRDVIETRAIRWDEFEEEINTPNYPDVVSATEIAAMLGVSRQRVHTLAVEHPDFPEPFYELGAGKIWLRSSIEGFAKRWTRKPGRPAKEAS